MANPFELLLDPDGTYEAPEQRAALAAALRKQQQYGSIGQLMGVAPTQQVGAAMHGQVEQSLRSALAKQQAAKESASRKAEREQAQMNWQAEQERMAARDREQQRQFAIQERRLREQMDRDDKRKYMHAVDPVTGLMRLYNTVTGEWLDETAGGGGAAPGSDPTAGLDIPIVGSANVPGSGKLTETQRSGAVRYGEGTIALRNALNAGFPDENRLTSLPDTAMWAANRAGFPQLASETVQGQQAFWSNVADPIVRARTGAAMPVEEFRTQMTMLIPRPGETPKVQMQKAQQLVAFLKSGTVGLPPQVQQHLLRQLAQIEMAIPKNELDWMAMREGEQGGNYAQPAPQQSQGPRPGDKYLGGP